MKKTIGWALPFSFISVSLALANTEIADYTRLHLNPSIKNAATSFQTHCKCPLKVLIDPSITARPILEKLRSLADNAESEARNNCATKPEYRAKACKIKTLTLKMAPTSEYKFTNGNGVFFCSDGTCDTSWGTVMENIK